MTELKPGKGLHLSLTAKMLDFLHECLEDIYNAYTPNSEGDDGNTLQDEGNADIFLEWVRGVASGWRFEKGDGKFSRSKVIKSMPYKEGELQVAVAAAPGNTELKLDIRFWYVG
jgi:hypothetical protein